MMSPSSIDVARPEESHDDPVRIGLQLSGRRSTAIGTVSLEGSTRGRRCGRIVYRLRDRFLLYGTRTQDQTRAACEDPPTTVRSGEMRSRGRTREPACTS